MLSKIKEIIVIILRIDVISKIALLLSGVFSKHLQFRLRNILLIPQKVKYKIPYTPSAYPEGVNFFGYLSAQMGLGQGARLYAKAIIDCKLIPYKLINIKIGNPASHKEKELVHVFSKEPLYNTNIIHINPEQFTLLNYVYPQKYWGMRYNIAVWLWELEDFPGEWIEAFKYTDEIWTPSTFTANCISKVSPVPVITIPYGICADTSERYDRRYFKLPTNKFLFLCMYDVNSTMERKNPMGAIDAFLSAFNDSSNDVGLVIKVNNAKPKDIIKINDYIGNKKNVYIIKKIMDKTEINSLIKSCDAFVSLHRSEGFGLVMAEAMYLGLPVIATNWSANTEFMSHENSCLVDYKFIDVGNNYYKSKPGQRWAAPSIEHAAYYMQKLFFDSQFYKYIAKAGQDYITTEFSMNKCAQKMFARLVKAGIISAR